MKRRAFFEIDGKEVALDIGSEDMMVVLSNSKGEQVKPTRIEDIPEPPPSGLLCTACHKSASYVLLGKSRCTPCFKIESQRFDAVAEALQKPRPV